MDNYNDIKFKILILNTIISLLCAQLAFSQDQQEIKIANEYYLRGEKAKAMAAYQQLIKNPANIQSVHANYFNLLLDFNNYKQAEDYIEKVIRRDDRLAYRLDLGIVYVRSGDLTKADKYFRSLTKANAEDAFKAKSISDYLANKNLIEYSIIALQQSRELSNNSHLFGLELANLYRIHGRLDQMVQEYLEYVTQTPANSGYIKNLMQILLTKPEELESLERLLTDKVQKNQDSEVLNDLLIWVNLQQKNFYGAFIQARAYDKRFHKEQSKSLEIAQIALNNQDYTNADRAFTYVVKEFANTENYLPAQLGLIKAREAKVKKNYPVNTDSVKYLIEEYSKFCTRYPSHPSAFEAKLNQAMLFAHYLNAPDSAVQRIDKLIADGKTPASLRNQAKIDLGDIYLSKGEPWESTLLYSQVEKSQRETPLGYEAKLRNAKLSYYKGDFKLAQEHLDILKQATTREIANDAMDLSMKIKENTTSDSTGSALKELAEIEFLVTQNKTDEALLRLERFSPKKSDSSSNAAIRDDVYWLEANLRVKRGQFKESIVLLGKIIEKYPDDILADDASFLQADIYETRLREKEKAKELYRAFLDKYPGSVYAAEARKRFRLLRGDFDNQKEVN